MPVVAFCGLRGGVGTTSITAALAWALNSLGERTLAIDFSPFNQLRMHFNTPYQQPRGWAHSALRQQPWQQSAMRYTPLLDFIPFGQLQAAESEAYLRNPDALLAPWAGRLHALRGDYRWVLLDIPADMPQLARQLLPQADHQVGVIVPDGNCHLRLHQAEVAENTRYLINQFNPVSKAQQDLHQLWIGSLNQRLPLLVHRDEALAEALLNKQPLGEYRPLSLAAEEIATLASWCLINLTGAPA